MSFLSFSCVCICRQFHFGHFGHVTYIFHSIYSIRIKQTKHSSLRLPINFYSSSSSSSFSLELPLLSETILYRFFVFPFSHFLFGYAIHLRRFSWLCLNDLHLNFASQMNLWLTYSRALFDKEKGTDFFLFKAIFFQTAFVNVENKFPCDLNKYLLFALQSNIQI